MREKIERLSVLYLELTDILQQEGSDQAKYLLRNIHHSLALIEERNLPEDLLFQELFSTYRGLTVPHAGLSDFYLWDEDFDTRIEANKAVDQIKSELHQIFWS